MGTSIIPSPISSRSVGVVVNVGSGVFVVVGVSVGSGVSVGVPVDVAVDVATACPTISTAAVLDEGALDAAALSMNCALVHWMFALPDAMAWNCTVATVPLAVV